MTGVPTIRDCQVRLIALGYDVGPTGADNLGGRKTQAAILQFQADHRLPKTGQFDQTTVNLLFSLRVPSKAAQAVVLSILTFIINQTLLKGTGMDLSKISKAIAAAISGAGIGGGAAAYAYISLPATVAAQLPSWVSTEVPIANMVIGAIVGFLIVYFAPANKPA